MPAVNPEILRWARETAGFSLEDAAMAIGLRDGLRATGAEKLARLEAGERDPSRSQLNRMASKYIQPLTAFYLSAPPRQADRGEDFRRIPDAPPIDFDPRLDALIRDVCVRSDMARELLEEEDAEPLAFVGSRQRTDGKGFVAAEITETIGFDLQAFRKERDMRSAFAYLRDRLESVGIFVVLLGDLGSYHSKIGAEIFRGYAIADPIAPFIVINDNDHPAAWSFTALHEAVHIWLGQTGVSGQSAAAQTQIERFCNEVAGMIVFPQEDVDALAELAVLGFDQQYERISETAAACNVSRRLVAYQLLRADIIDGARYQQIADRIYSEWLRSKSRDPDEPRDGRGPNAHVVKRHRLSPALVSLAQRSVTSGALSPTKASKLLGVKPGSVYALLDMRMV